MENTYFNREEGAESSLEFNIINGVFITDGGTVLQKVHKLLFAVTL